MAVANYEDEHGRYPPPFTTDEHGNRMHSWRVLLLPYLEQQELYDQINLDEPWNSPTNRRLADQMPAIYSFHGEYLPGATTANYLAVVGEETIWPPEGRRCKSDVVDQLHQTVLLIENSGCSICWMEPRDLELDTLPRKIQDPQGISSKYLDPAVVDAFGTVMRLSEDISPDTIRAMLTVAGGEVLQNDGPSWSVLADGRDRAVRPQ